MIVLGIFIVCAVGLPISIPIVVHLKRGIGGYFDNNAAVHQLLTTLQHYPLPPDSRLLFETSEVGGIFYPAGYATMGESPNFMAYRIFVTDLPPEKVTQFFQPYSTLDSGVFPLSQPPHYGSFPIESIIAHVAPSERNHAWVLYDFGRADEMGLSDPRLW
jgi:hypothetical protein